MNRILFALLVLCSTSLAGDRPTGFLGIVWGASPEEAKRVMQAREGVKFPEGTDDYRFELTGGKFAGQPVTRWVFNFPERKFASATVVIKPDGNGPTLFKEFRTHLVSKYGSATTDKKLTDKPARKRAMYPAEKQATFGSQASWKFNSNMKEKETISVSCELAGPNGTPARDESQLMLTIHYANDTLVAAAQKNTAAAGTKGAPVSVKKEEL